MASNNDGYQNHNRASTITVTVLALVFVLLRFLARYVNNKGYGIEDILLTLAMIGDLILLALDLDAVNHGLGLYLVDFPLEYFQLCNQLIFAYELIWNLTMATIKMTIRDIMGYCRCVRNAFSMCTREQVLEPFRSRPLYQQIGLLPWWLNTEYIVGYSNALFAHPKCMETSLLNDHSNFINLRFYSGCVLFASFYRLVPIVAYSSDETSFLLTLKSLESDSAAINLAWATIEVSCAIISACLPTLRPLLRLVWRGFDSTNRSVSNNPYPTRNSQRVQQSHPAGHFSDEEPLRAISVETRIDITALPNAPERSWFVERLGVT
ncbi:hypothetical protein BGW36DRAFT_358926 [Talaromyces proteolyticus]|uniref:Integral membrane protein n=1 Tax=Talaromyces proteolyticus TaxID=1131652 RepID=A0AAD4KQH4_9EURO|nr:uncharacterized protein BGW36DRAFT_358926 [Talaromyces proteolyticus]KAH8697114.1 hypothetical protein BGW36DRAFT_358926 [Talaromyces proteolyticus]